MRSAPHTLSSGRLRRNVALVMVVLGLLASACGSASSPAASVAGSETSTGSAEGLVGEFDTFDETTLDLATLQGEDVVLWFWAPW